VNPFDDAARLAGFFMAHGIWCVSDGGPLVPLVAYEGSTGRQMVRLAAERLEDSVAQGQKWLETNPAHALRAVMVHDAFVTFDGVRRDALIATVLAYEGDRRKLEIVVPYRPVDAPGGFAVYRPKFVNAVGLSADNLSPLGDCFFEGVDGHEKGAAVWNQHIDQSA
jgi:hypothetical protein